eukprot:CAMPEP_0174385668 /NCGR_PEP_ID=MMETSP0811_2-20130205/126755_1 /TAXON_ID=73025 ORGANISM="Eutreptiella gymnastica-like, Strain CCMP1594" /NCGR_SAMPLE_ID=MMETSP0811_2 /ASSEMBLY_ACC=CAM_ASM_000667 /LENGTH=119 /DNA_ID=CAMNT_0015540063 /DNA_START=715 /DNA_END=1075 /DNA_ORIENTATION=-
MAGQASPQLPQRQVLPQSKNAQTTVQYRSTARSPRQGSNEVCAENEVPWRILLGLCPALWCSVAQPDTKTSQDVAQHPDIAAHLSSELPQFKNEIGGIYAVGTWRACGGLLVLCLLLQP